MSGVYMETAKNMHSPRLAFSGTPRSPHYSESYFKFTDYFWNLPINISKLQLTAGSRNWKRRNLRSRWAGVMVLDFSAHQPERDDKPAAGNSLSDSTGWRAGTRDGLGRTGLRRSHI